MKTWNCFSVLYRFLENMKMPVGVPRSSGFQICDILDLNEQAKTAQSDSEQTHSKFGNRQVGAADSAEMLTVPLISGPLQTVLPGSGHPIEFSQHFAASLAAQQAHLAGLYSHTLANHDALHMHSQWPRQDPPRHGKSLPPVEGDRINRPFVEIKRGRASHQKSPA